MGDAMIRSVLNWLFYQWGYARSIVGNEGGFVHKKLLGFGAKLAGAIIPGAQAITEGVGVVRGFLGQPIATARPTVSRFTTARVTTSSIGQRELGARVKFGPEAMGPGTRFAPTIPLPQHPRNGRPRGSEFCQPGFVWNAELGTCVAVGSPVAARFAGGQPVLGQHGAGMVAGSRIVDVATCNKGMVLGDDGVCYNKRQISNKERMWPAGRKPLLTGGQMNAISIAARAGGRLELATKRLQKMGMMKKPTRRIAAPRGHVARLEHASEH